MYADSIASGAPELMKVVAYIYPSTGQVHLSLNLGFYNILDTEPHLSQVHIESDLCLPVYWICTRSLEPRVQS